MEFPNLGTHCSESSCNRLDFLPIKCDGCSKMFCSEHMTYGSHKCPTPKRWDKRVQICPICSLAVPYKSDDSPDEAVNDHIEKLCESNRHEVKRIFHECSFYGCKIKEAVSIICEMCSLNFCVVHRHPLDHMCHRRTARTERDPKRPPKRVFFNIEEPDETEALSEALKHKLKKSSKKNKYRIEKIISCDNDCLIS